MKIALITFFLVSLGLISCEIEGVKSDKTELQTLEKNTSSDTISKQVSKITFEEFKDSVENILPENAVDEKVFNNGLKITWFKRGEGKKVKQYDVVNIDYRNKLPDGAVYDGNHFIKKKFIAFPVGWNQQTPGWELAMKELSVGDEVEVFIPAKLARGEKGIPGRVPPNTDNILSLRILKKVEPTKTVDGTKLYLIERSEKYTKTVSDTSDISIDYFVSTPTNPRYDNSYQRGVPFSLHMGDGNIVPGLYKSLKGMRKMDKLFIHIPANQAYGKNGLKPNVKPNQDLFYDLILSDVKN